MPRHRVIKLCARRRVVPGLFPADGRSLITLSGHEGLHWTWPKDAAPVRLLTVDQGRTWRLSPRRTLALSLGTEVSLWDTTTGEKRGSLVEDAAESRYGLRSALTANTRHRLA